MSFLNATLIFGVAAAALPIVLHLIARREPQRQVFPAVRFLTQRLEVHRSRLKIRRWLLLAFRAALLGLLALAFARPQIHQAAAGTWLTIGILAAASIGLLGLAAIATTRDYARSLTIGLLVGGGLLLLTAIGWGTVVWAGSAPVTISDTAPAAVAILLDNSPSSGYTTQDSSRIEAIKATATWLVSRYPADSRIAILDRSSRPASFALDGAAAMRAIDKAKPLQTMQPLAERIEAAVRLVRSSDLERRAVFVLSDLTKASWTPSDAPDASLALPPLLAELPDVALQVVDVARIAAGENLTQSSPTAVENRRLALPKISDTTPAREVAVPLSIRVSLEPGTPPSAVRAELQLYELSTSLPVIRDNATVLPPLRVVDRTSAEVTDEAPAELLLTLPPLLPGTHHGRIELAGNDPLAIDDVRYFAVTVRPPAKLLFVSDDPPAAAHLERTLNAEFQPGDPRAEFSIERIATRQFRADSLVGVDAVALLDPAPRQFDDEAIEALLTWVEQGGNAMVALGAAGQDGVLPNTAIDGGEETPRRLLFPLRRVWRAPEPGTFLEVTRPSHPVFSELAEIPGGVPWSPFRVNRYWQLALRPTDAVLARYAGTRNAALLERPIGNGRILFMTTPIAPSSQHRLASWNEWFSAADAWPSFLLMREIFDYVGNRDAGTFNVLVGQPVAVPLDNTVGEPQRLQMFTAEAAPAPVPVEGHFASIGTVREAGNYWLRGAATPVGFAANLPAEATQLATIETALLQEILGEGNYELVADRDSIVAAEGRSNEARPLYAQAMLLVLALFLFEQLLANRFYRSARTMTAQTPRLRATGAR